MASLLAAENWSCMDVDVMDTNDHFPGATGQPAVSLFSSNNALLMSLLEETQGDQEHDEERLSSLIRALEVELIDPATTEGHKEIFMDNNAHQFGSINQEGFQPFDAGSVNGGDSLEIDSSGFGCIDKEIASSSQCIDESAVDWYTFLDEIESSSNFGGPQEYNNSISTIPFDHHNLWQETYTNTRMHV